LSAGDTAQTAGHRRCLEKRQAGFAADIPRGRHRAPSTFTRSAIDAGYANLRLSRTAPDKAPKAALLAGLDWLDSLSLTGLDGQNLNEIGLKNGNLIVDDQQRGKLNGIFPEHLTQSSQAEAAAAWALSVGEEGETPPGRSALRLDLPPTACDRSTSAPSKLSTGEHPAGPAAQGSETTASTCRSAAN